MTVEALSGLVKTIVAAGVRTREDWHEWKRDQKTFLTQTFDYRPEEGMPDVSQIVAPHFHSTLPLVGLNYTPAAGVSLHHYERGWSPCLRLCRGITFDRTGRLVARPFPKFQNFGENGGEWGVGPCEVTVKEDGHLLIVFRYGDQVLCKTRGDFHSPTAELGAQAIKHVLAPAWMDADWKDITVLCEMIHPDTKVQVDYGDRRALILIGLFDNTTGEDLPIAELRVAGDAFGLEVVREVPLTYDDLLAVVNGGGNNAEGFVARWRDGHRVKFKYRAYMDQLKETRAERQEEDRAVKSRPMRDTAIQRAAPWLRRPV